MKKIALFSALVFLLLCAAAIFPLYGCGSGRITAYNIECEIDENYTLTGEETVKFFNDTEKSFTHLKFNLFANAFREGANFAPINSQYNYIAYKNGKSYGKAEVLWVKQKKQELEFSVCGEDLNILDVTLKEEIFPSDSVEVTIFYKIQLANVVARTGYNDKTVNLANFYPILCGIDDNGFYECVYYSEGDPYFSDCANYNVTFTAPTKYTVAHSGKTIKEVEKDGKSTYNFQLKNARSFCMVMSEYFECITANENGIEINYYYYNDQNPTASIDYAVKSIKTFSGLFGDYAYDVYSVVQTEFVQGGMEFPTLVMISDEVKGESYGEVIVHETAHQWWQTAVGNNEIEYSFLDEGLAEYSTILFYENNPEYSVTRENLVKISETSYKTFCSVYDKIFGKVNTAMLRSLKDFSSEYEYVNIAYIKSCVMYDLFRKTVGEEKFFNGLKTYYNEYKFKNASPYDLVACFVKMGADAEGFFSGFFDGKVIL